MVAVRLYCAPKSHRFGQGPIEMAHDFEQKYVGLVAGIIGAVVLLLGIAGLLFNIS